MKVKTTIFILTAILALTFFCSAASAQSWEEVATVSGNSDEAVAFHIDADNWRIRWEYDPQYTYGVTFAYMGILTKNQTDSGWEAVSEAQLSKTGGEDTSGVIEVTGSGDYQLGTFIANIESYQITIEQDTDSIPITIEPLNMTAVIIAIAVIGAIAAIMAVVILVKRKRVVSA